MNMRNRWTENILPAFVGVGAILMALVIAGCCVGIPIAVAVFIIRLAF